MTFSTGLKVGLLAGLPFFLHAMIPSSHAWPLIWPLMGGAAAVYLISRRGGGPSFRESLQASATAGLASAAVFLVATAAALFLLSRPGFNALARSLGAEDPLALNGPILIALTLAALIGFAAATCSGALTHPLTRRRI